MSLGLRRIETHLIDRGTAGFGEVEVVQWRGVGSCCNRCLMNLQRWFPLVSTHRQVLATSACLAAGHYELWSAFAVQLGARAYDTIDVVCGDPRTHGSMCSVEHFPPEFAGTSDAVERLARPDWHCKQILPESQQNSSTPRSVVGMLRCGRALDLTVAACFQSRWSVLLSLNSRAVGCRLGSAETAKCSSAPPPAV